MKLRFFATLFLGLIATGKIQAQELFEINNRHFSQSHLNNPGFMPQYKLSLSAGTSSFGMGLVGFDLNSVFNSNELTKQTVNRLMNEDDKQLGIDIRTRVELFHFGFRSLKSYISFNSSIIAEGSVRMPKDMLGLAFYGNSAYIDRDANLDFSGTEFQTYMQNTLSYGRHITNELSIGVNLSQLNGLAYMGFDKAYMSINTDTGTSSIYSMAITGELDGKASLVGGSIASVINDSNYYITDVINNNLSNGFNPINSNRGFAAGFGAVYRLNERWRFSGSVQNVGSIMWDYGVESVKMNQSTWTWNGLDTNQISDFNDNTISNIIDTAIGTFEVKAGSISSFERKLKPRYNIGAEFFLHPRTLVQVFGGVGYGAKGDKAFVSTSIHQELNEFLDLRLSYSYFDPAGIANHRVGLGMSLNLGPLQAFFAVNDILAPINYGSITGVSGMAGVNINIITWKDRDHDMTPDRKDSCLKVYGVLSNKGCPYGFLGESMNNKEELTKDSLLLDNTQIKSDSESAKPGVGTEQPYTEVSAEEAAMEKPKKVKKEKAPKAAKEPKPVKEKKKKKEADATDLMNN
jgi:hypothetical protein